MSPNTPLENLVLARYPLPEWATILEFTGGVGSSGWARRADIVTFNCWPSKGWHRLAFEVKRTRGDFMREVDNPRKRKWLEENFHQCYFVVLPNIVKEDELPEGWGLLVATQAGDKLIRRKAAQHREIGDLPEALALAAIRRLATSIQEERGKHYLFQGETLSQVDIDAKVEERLIGRRLDIEKEWEDVRKLRQTLADRRCELEGPISALAREAGEYGIFDGWRQKPEKITSEDVLRWVKHIRAHAIKTVMMNVWRAREELTGLIEAAKAEGLDTGEPKHPHTPRKLKL